MDERLILLFMLFFLVIIYVDGSACGNAVLEEGEFCDLNKLSGENCTNFNYTGGKLSCLDDCSGYDFDTCSGDEVCGNTIIGSGELCEIGNVRNRTCIDEGYLNGTLSCHSSCVKYDYSECGGEKAECGDGVVSGFEDCDVGLNNKTCEDLDYDFGVLSCYSNCSFNVKTCFNEVILELNESFNEGLIINETTENISEISEIDSGVENVSSVEGLSFGVWLLIILGIFIVGIIGIWFFVFKK